MNSQLNWGMTSKFNLGGMVSYYAYSCWGIGVTMTTRVGEMSLFRPDEGLS